MLGRSATVSLAEALRLMRLHLLPGNLEEEKLPLEEALGRITSQEVRSPENLPAYPRSTMDGYAVRARDTFGASEGLPAYLEVSGEVRMGELPVDGPMPGTCLKIATGGIIPPGADAVVMLEHTVNVDERMIEVVQAVAEGGNVIATGEDVSKGQTLLHEGHRLRPQDLGLLAGLGIASLVARRKVKVGIFSTGDEVVHFRETPAPGKIRDINFINLSALTSEAGALPTYYGIVPDNESRLLEVARKALNENDIMLFSGSSSVGARDLGERIINTLGPPGIIVHGVSIKPGKPVIIAVAEGKPVFGLPGHPVSTSVSFELFVLPALKHIAGIQESGLPQWRTIQARIMRNINSAPGRTDFIRVEVRILPDDKPAEAYPVLGKSGAISTLVKADGYVVISENRQGIKEGEIVEVRLFS